METITIDWRCGECGSVRRTDVTDPAAAVYVFRPANWVIDRGRAKCEQCVLKATKVTVTTPDGVVTDHSGEWQTGTTTADDMRARMSGLHAARPEGGPIPPARMLPGTGGVSSANAVRRAPNPGDPMRQPGVSLGPGGGGVETGGITAAGGAGGSAGTRPPRDQGTDISSRELRPGGGNIVFADTRRDEFLGPPKTVAGVPTLTEKCIGCHMGIADGTDGRPSEAWRLASNSLFERGHNACLDQMGR